MWNLPQKVAGDLSGFATNRELTEGLELNCGASTVKTFWQKLVERYRRNQADLDQIVLELAREEASKPLLQPFPKTIQSLDNYTFLRVWIFRCVRSLGLFQGIGHSILQVKNGVLGATCPITRLYVHNPLSGAAGTRVIGRCLI